MDGRDRRLVEKALGGGRDGGRDRWPAGRDFALGGAGQSLSFAPWRRRRRVRRANAKESGDGRGGHLARTPARGRQAKTTAANPAGREPARQDVARIDQRY